LIHVEREDAVALVTIDRPEAMNALDVATLTELRDGLRELAGDESARAVIVTGAGEKAFVAGADIKYMSGLDVDQAKEWGALGHEAGRLLETMPKPTIAAINGFALGGGCELALACDVVLECRALRLPSGLARSEQDASHPTLPGRQRPTRGNGAVGGPRGIPTPSVPAVQPAGAEFLEGAVRELDRAQVPRARRVPALAAGTRGEISGKRSSAPGTKGLFKGDSRIPECDERVAQGCRTLLSARAGLSRDR
jgi:hypothetical protein